MVWALGGAWIQYLMVWTGGFAKWAFISGRLAFSFCFVGPLKPNGL